MYQSQRPQHGIEKTPSPNVQHQRDGIANVWGNSVFCPGCKEFFLADTSWQEIITADHIQHSIWALQIPKYALWQKFRQWSISALHGPTVRGLPLLSHRRWHHHRRPWGGWTPRQLEKGARRAQEVNLRLHPDKCKFLLDQVAYLGQIKRWCLVNDVLFKHQYFGKFFMINYFPCTLVNDTF